MPDTQLTEPFGTEGEQWLSNLQIEEYSYDVAQSGNLVNGTVVIFESTSTSQPPLIKAATTTPAFTTAGVIINAPTGGYVPGSIVQVVTHGVTQILCDANNTTSGHLLITGSTTAGTATDSATVTAGKTIARCLQTVTIASGTALVYGCVVLI
jgi:hypothetical protein